MKYRYVASKKDGTLRRGTRKSASETALSKALIKEGLSPIEIVPDKKILAFFYSAKKLLDHNVVLSVKPLEKALFTKHLSIILSSGLNLEEGLSISKDQAKGPFKKILERVGDSVQSGISLADSMGQYPRIFPAYMRQIIRIGEESGNLPENLTHLSEQLFKEIKVRKNIMGAMIYPIMIFSIAVLLGLGIVIFILPKVTTLFESIDFELPLVTRILIGFANIVSEYGVFILLGFVILAVLVRILWKYDPVKYAVQRILLATPVIKKMSRQANLARVTRSLSTLISAGIPTSEALNSICEGTPNLVYQRSLKRVVTEVEKGLELAEVMSMEERYFPKMTYRLIKVGESTGELESVLVNLAEYYENEVELSSKNITVLIEPIMLIFVALCVGLLAIGVLLPIYLYTTSASAI